MVVGKEQTTTLEEQLAQQRTTAATEAQKVTLQEQLAQTRATSAQVSAASALTDLQAQQAAKELTTSMQQGELPSNPVIANILERGEAVTASTAQNPSLSSDARSAAEDLRNMLAITREMFLQKNSDEALQRMVYHAKEATAATSAASSGGQVLQSGAPIKQTASQIAMSTYNLVLLMARSTEFRRLVMDLINMVGDFTGNEFEGVTQSIQQSSTTQEATQEVSERVNRQASSFKQAINNDEFRERLIQRFHRWIKEVDRRNDFRQGVYELVQSLDDFAMYAQETNADLRNNPDLLQARLHSARARAEAKKLMERFAQGQSLDDVTFTLKRVVTDIKNDERISAYIDSVRSFVMRSIQEPHFAATDEWLQQARQKANEGRTVFESVRPDMNEFLNKLKLFMRSFSGDPQLTALSQSSKSFVQRLFLDESGNPKFKPGVLLELRNILGPLLQEELKYIYVPRLASDDENITWVLDNVMLRGEDVMPDKIVVENYNKLVVSPTNVPTGEQNLGATLRVHISGIRAHLHDVRMAYSRKTFPKMEDVISFDAHLSGEGLNIEIILSTTPVPDHVFRIVSINTDIDDFSLNNIHGVDHSNMLYTLMKPVIQTQVRRNMEASITEAIAERLQDLDQMLLKYRENISFS